MAENLTIDQAKARLREVRPVLEPESWMHTRPFAMLLIAAAAGGLSARLPRNRVLPLLDLLVQLILPDDEDLGGP